MPRPRHLPLALLALLAAVSAGADTGPSKPREAGLTSAELAADIRQADRIVIVYSDPAQPTVSRDALVEDSESIGRLLAAIEAGPLPGRPHCLCISMPEIEVYHTGRPLLRLTLHHGTKLRLAGRLAGDFEIGPERGQIIGQVLREHEARAKERLLPAQKPPQK